MKKKSASQSAFFNLRVLIGVFVAVATLAAVAVFVKGNPVVQPKESKPATVEGDGKFAPVCEQAEQGLRSSPAHLRSYAGTLTQDDASWPATTPDSLRRSSSFTGLQRQAERCYS